MSRTATRDRRERTRVGRNRYVGLAARLDRENPSAPASLPVIPPPAGGRPGEKFAGATAVAPVPVSVPALVSEHELTSNGGGEAWHGACSCGKWSTSKPMKRESNVRGAHTRHRNAISNTTGGVTG